MIELARCSRQQRIVIAGAKSVELMLELKHRGYLHVAGQANCGLPAGQYDVALIDWRRRTFLALETALDRLTKFVGPAGQLVVWVDPQKAAANENLRAALERRGFVIEAATVHECGCAFAGRRRELTPLRKAA
jgi:hypothetical protein